MTVATQQRGGGGYVERGGSSSSLADVVELILDKGLVVDVFVRVSLVGIEILTVDARIVVASVDTYLRFAEATDRLDLYAKGGKDLPGLVEGVTEGGAKGKTAGVLDAAVDKVGDMLDGGREREAQPRPRPSSRQNSDGRRPRSRERAE
ncbi:gas vesicle protein [Pseudonocardia sp. CNS-139]|nr:gas vesicle protein [Pseudonocardia sp. CNS-139]